MSQLIILPDTEYGIRLGNIQRALSAQHIDAALITDNANKYYITGRVFSGSAYIPAEGMPIFFVRRPVGLEGDGVIYVRKPEEMAASIGLNMPHVIGLELDVTPYSTVERLKKIFSSSDMANVSKIMSQIRSVKTDYEIVLIRQSGVKHERVYRRIPHIFRSGMTDIEFQIEIERISRLEGCLGQFRISGNSMELFMGNILTGKNADNPTPYDFAMGGEGIDPSLPVGANGSVIRPGETIMVDLNGNYTGYMTDMTRTFSLGNVEPLASKAHECSIAICHEIAKTARQGMEAKALYELAEKIVAEHDLHAYFMGHRQKAGFIGHGVGIEINEAPVIAPRSRDILAIGNVVALEPKFVIPGVGAVGIENTYVLTADGLKSLTNAPEQLINLE